MPLPRIYADFNALEDKDPSFVLDTMSLTGYGTLASLARKKVRAAMKTSAVCLFIELVVFLLFLAGLRNAVEALYWTVLIGPVSLFVAPMIYRKFREQQA